MILLNANQLVKEYGGEPLFNPLSFEIGDGERIALIGPNGTGKSTIIKMIIGELSPDSGTISAARDCSIGYLSQTVISDLNHTLYQEAEDVFAPLIALGARLAAICAELEKSPDSPALLSEYAELEHRFESAEGYSYQYRIKTILNYFNFRPEDYDRPISSFSGGERMKVAFAKLLLQRPRLLILDEPTNHLDISTIEWLEEYLKSYQGAIFFVSHDRYFINALANRIFELENRELSVYTGDYDRYAAEKKSRYESQLKQYMKEEAVKKKLEWFISYYMPKPRFVSRAHDREKKLARLEANRTSRPVETKSHVHFDFRGSVRSGKRLLEARDLSIGYEPGRPLVSGINFRLTGGDRLAVMGENGSGKTTFVKTLLGKIPALHGRIDRYDDFSIGYLPQDGLLIRSPLSIYEYFRDRFPLLVNQRIYDHLGAFDFSYEDDQKIIDNLSGGEKMRVVLAELVLQDYDILVLDEPTNHLDMMTKEELLAAIRKYRGSLVVISHDRSFVDSIADHLLYFENRQAYSYAGDYSHFKAEKLDDIFAEKARLEEEQLERERAAEAERQSRLAAVRELEKKTQVRKPRPSLAKNKIEEKLARLERLMEAEQQKLDDPDYYHDQLRLAAVQDQLYDYSREYEKLMEQLALYDE